MYVQVHELCATLSKLYKRKYYFLAVWGFAVPWTQCMFEFKVPNWTKLSENKVGYNRKDICYLFVPVVLLHFTS